MKKVLVYLVLVIVFLILFMVDISNYDLQENETLSSVGDELNFITYPHVAEFVIEDVADLGRARFYSGQVFNDGSEGPFIIGFRKHWLLAIYSAQGPFLRYNVTYIEDRGKDIGAGIFKYTAMQVDESLQLSVERRLHQGNIFRFLATLAASLYGGHIGSQRKKRRLMATDRQ